MRATTIANYMIYIMGDAFDDLTNMKINKLLYFAQGHYLKKYGVPLFEDTIEAWSHGPVVPSVYSAYKKYGDKPITEYTTGTIGEVSPKAEELLYGIARNYGKYTASALRNMTHVIGSPWDLVYREGCTNIEIPLSSIRTYFEGIDDLPPASKQFNDSDFIGYRDKDGFLVLPKGWDY